MRMRAAKYSKTTPCPPFTHEMRETHSQREQSSPFNCFDKINGRRTSVGSYRNDTVRRRLFLVKLPDLFGGFVLVLYSTQFQKNKSETLVVLGLFFLEMIKFNRFKKHTSNSTDGCECGLFSGRLWDAPLASASQSRVPMKLDVDTVSTFPGAYGD